MRQRTIYSNKIPAVSVAVYIISRGQSSCLQTHFSVSILFIHSKWDFSFSGKKRKPERMVDAESVSTREREGKCASGCRLKRNAKWKISCFWWWRRLEWSQMKFDTANISGIIIQLQNESGEWTLSESNLLLRSGPMAAGNECPSIRCSSLRFEHSPSFSNTARMQLRPNKRRIDRKTDASFISWNATCIWLLKVSMSRIAGNVRVKLHVNSQVRALHGSE